MSEYRTREERRITAQQDDRIKRVLDQAVHDAASIVAAMLLGEPAEVAERWTNAVYDHLRTGLRDDNPAVAGLRQEDRLRAIVILLEDRIKAEATRLVRGA